MSVTATVTNISRCSLHDGPGVRTVIYFKGCGLRCRWCHNPETLSAERQLLYIPSKCIRCGHCLEICPEHHFINGDVMVLERNGCSFCGKCADICPSGALAICGEEKTADELLDVIKKDIHYYEASGGGVTFSGGECLLRPEFLKRLAVLCQNNGIHTAIETALFVPWQNIEALIPHTDLFFADLKIADSKKHKEYIGQENGLIIENLIKLSKEAKSVIIRIPVIPGVNDSYDDLIAFSDIIKQTGSLVSGVELLKYNNLAHSKYDMLDAEYFCFSEEPQSDETMKELCKTLSTLSGRECYFG